LEIGSGSELFRRQCCNVHGAIKPLRKDYGKLKLFGFP
jgi:hypothetical protein